MRRIVRLVIALSVLAGSTAPASLAAERMWVGFHDDPSFRWVRRRDRQARIAGAAQSNATIMRLLVQWNLAAKTRPTNATDPFDPAYEFDDIDEAVRSAQENDQEVILTISGTPRWANGGKNPNVMPTRVADFTNFSRAIASRYSGRFMGYPVRALLVDLERAEPPALPEPAVRLARALGRAGELREARRSRVRRASRPGTRRPRSRSARRPLAAATRPTGCARRTRPASSPSSSRRRTPGSSSTPGRTIRIRRVRTSPPSQVVKWPNVSLASLPKFDDNLKTWFKRKSVPIWVTEYGHQTRPEDPLGIPYSTQAAYIQQSISIAAGYPFVNMFIWFVYQDDQGQPWDSGIYTRGGAPKGTSPARFTASARPLDARNGLTLVRAGTLTPLLNVYTRRYCATDTTGTPIGMTWRVFKAGRLISVGQQSAPLRIDCSIAARVTVKGGVAKGISYTVTFALNDRSGVILNRRITLRGT